MQRASGRRQWHIPRNREDGSEEPFSGDLESQDEEPLGTSWLSIETTGEEKGLRDGEGQKLLTRKTVLFIAYVCCL